jgi:HD-like signal output (HDOD) protein
VTTVASEIAAIRKIVADAQEYAEQAEDCAMSAWKLLREVSARLHDLQRAQVTVKAGD